ncbi:23S rRNA Um-2552 2'-O-methyltransferase [Desulfonauticus submarinus]|uniref:Ribosomal RNA large subunit methyltransferase E n=1 Tax=Desulfonauticus submarinus TaxID=206665 RepID=A0A1H0GHC4_9BACT|nr:RlmE family RNA methyltransferase [Desulfonauticus submarinus]SDO06300.1 23S rRNA Um-2552 2'-O-methyltransferase [Desulfonauticus submarinus]
MKQYRDYYFKKAKQENYPARSVYKLKEIDARFKLLKRGFKVLDLGASPGSWTLFCSKKVGPSGFVVGVDLNPLKITLPKGVYFFQDDVFSPSDSLKQQFDELGEFDLVLSDMAPKTTGIKFADQARSYDLAVEALFVAKKWLKQGGNFVVKIFVGPDVPEFLKQTREIFKQVKQFKPKSSRSESKEIFIIGLKKI